MSLAQDAQIVVTGGAGFIGSAVVRHLNDRGYTNIIVVDDLGSDDKWRNLVGKQVADVIPIQPFFTWLNDHVGDLGAIIHLGACSSTVEKDASYLLENNYRFSQRLAEKALSHDIRFIYASSAATYGDGTQGFDDSHDQLEALQPLNMYGYSKHLFDLWAKRQGVLDRLVGLKYFNVFGPNEFHKGRMASVITKMVPSIQQDGVIRLFKSSDPSSFSDGEQKRDFIYVKDAVRMTCAFLDNDAGGLYNIGRGIPETWNTIARAVFAGLSQPVNIVYVDMPEDLVGKYQNYTCATMEKTRGVLGNVADTPSIDTSVVEYVRNYLLADQTW